MKYIIIATVKLCLERLPYEKKLKIDTPPPSDSCQWSDGGICAC